MEHENPLGVVVEDSGEAAELPHPKPAASGNSRGTAGNGNSTTPIPMKAGEPAPPVISNAIRPTDSLSIGGESDASLHSPRDGHSHNTVHETREESRRGSRPRICTRCARCIPRRRHRTVESPVPEPDSDTTASTSEPRNETEDAAGISYGIQYLMSDGRFSSRAPWSGPFHLESVQRGSAEGRRERLLIFDTILVLSKSACSPSRFGGPGRNGYSPGLLDVLDARMEFWQYSTQAIIHSRKFIEALKGLVSYYPAINLEVPELRLNEPYSILAHHLEGLEDLSSMHNPSNTVSSGSEIPQQSHGGNMGPEVADDGACQHVGEILKVIKENVWKDSICKEKARYAQTPSVCTFSMLWLLYKPGDTVYAEEDGKLAAYVINSVNADRSSLRVPSHEQRALKLSLWYLDYTGKHIRRHARTIAIAPFAGERQVAALNVIPCRIVDDMDSGKTKRMLEEEGRRWYGLLQIAQVRYTGETLGKVRTWVSMYRSTHPLPRIVAGLTPGRLTSVSSLTVRHIGLKKKLKRQQSQAT